MNAKRWVIQRCIAFYIWGNKFKMNSILRIPLIPSLEEPITREPSICIPIQYIEFNIHSLIDDHRYIIEKVDSCYKKIGYEGLIQLSDWLYAYYKKINHYILSERILDSLMGVLSFANDIREKVR